MLEQVSGTREAPKAGREGFSTQEGLQLGNTSRPVPLTMLFLAGINECNPYLK